MNWYLLFTKPRQESIALENLIRQGYECYLPTMRAEKIRRGALTLVDEPLFPRYLFIRLGSASSSTSWGPIRSTKGVSRLVIFGAEPARVGDALIAALAAREGSSQTSPKRLFNEGDPVRLMEPPFVGIEGVYQIADGARRAVVLIEILSKVVRVPVAQTSLRKVR